MLQEYYISTFHIQLINDPNILNAFSKVYIYIKKESQQILITSTKGRNNTTISFSDEEGFIFTEEELSIKNPVRVEIHEYLINEDNDGDINSNETDIFSKDSLLGITTLQLNHFSSRIYHPTKQNLMIGEFIYTLKPHLLEKCSTPKNLSATVTPIKDLNISERITYNEVRQASKSCYTPQRSNIIMSESGMSNCENEITRGLNQYEMVDVAFDNNDNSSLQTQQPSNLTFFKILSQQPPTQQILSNEEDSTETPTSKLISSQGDLNSSRQFVPQQMSKSTHVAPNANEPRKTRLCISPNKYLVVEKTNIFKEIRTPKSPSAKSIIESAKVSNNGSPFNGNKQVPNKSTQQYPQSTPQMQIQQQQQQQQHIVTQNNQQNIQSFSQYLAYQQFQNNSINQFNKFQNFNQYQNSPIYTPQQASTPQQQQINRIQLNSTPYSNGYSNIIHTLPAHQNNLFQNNNNVAAICTPQHRIIPQSSPIPQQLQNHQIPVFRGNGFQHAPLQFKTSPFTINQRF